MKSTFIRAISVIAALTLSLTVMAQNISVSGVVTDASDGQPIIGAGVTLPSGAGTVTDYEGKYVISAPKGASLTISSLGYIPVTIEIGGRTVVNAELTPDTQLLEEVVVLGYTAQKKAELSSSVVSMSGDELRDVSTSDVGNMLQGKVAGVVIMNSTGAAGAQADIRIRGTGSITAGAGPLFVVDGVAGGSYNPNDIETITVLKDASATALYGAAAAGGVIVVTTKGGNQDKTTVEFKASAGIKKALTGRFHAMNSEEYWNYKRSMVSTALANIQYPDYLLDRDFDWVNNCFKTGVVQNYFASVAGKAGKVNYYVSLDHFNEKGTLINNRFRRTSARLNLSAPITDRFTIQVRLNYAQSHDQSYGWRTLENSYYMIPWDVPYRYDDEGNLTNELIYVNGSRDDTADGKWFSNNASNVLHSEQYNYARSSGDDLTGDLQLNWNVTDWLTLTSINRYATYNSFYEEYTDPKTFEGLDGHGTLVNADGEGNGWGTTNLAKFHKTFDVHDVSAIVGWEYGEGYNRDMSATGQNFLSGQRALSSSVMSGISGSDYLSRSWALLAQAQYSYMGKYVATASIRYDESYKFGPLNRGGVFPGVSAAWLISKEKFMQTQQAFTFLKLRAGFGKTGNDNIPAFSYQDTFSLSAQYNGQKAAVLDRMANLKLGWEEAYMTSVGVDATIKNNVNVTLDLYHTINDRILIAAPMAPSTGFFSVMDNVGKVRNMGVELAVDGAIFNKKNFGWTAGMNLGFNKNTVLELPEHQQMVLTKEGVSQILVEGQEVYTWYMPKWVGVDPENGKPQWEKIDENGNVTIVNQQTQATNQIVGSASPWFSGGINTSLRLYGFTLTAHGSFVVGNKIYNKMRESMDTDGAVTDLNQMSIDNGLGWSRWEEPGDIATHPKPSAARPDGSQLVSSRFLEDGSFFRLRNVTLSYNLPTSLIQKIKMSSARVYISADNVLTLSRFSLMDPEVRLDADTSHHAGMYYHNYPVPMSVVFGIDVKF